MKVPNLNKTLCCFLMALLPACTNHAYQFKVDGVSGEFCVPKTGYVAPSIWYLPKDSPGTPNGFSFGGCHRLQESDRASCALPNELISADVSPLSVKRNHTWRELKTAAIYNEMISKPGIEYQIDANSQMLVLRNSSVWKEWSIWQRGPAKETESGLRMHDDDELVVSCASIEEFPGGADGLGRKGQFGCERYVRGARYALQYRFVSDQRVPDQNQLKKLESSLFEQVNRWQCK